MALCRYLPGLEDIATVISQRNSELAYMLVDSKVQHNRGSPVEEMVEQLTTGIGEPLLLGKLLFHRYQRMLVNSKVQHNRRSRAENSWDRSSKNPVLQGLRVWLLSCSFALRSCLRPLVARPCGCQGGDGFRRRSNTRSCGQIHRKTPCSVRRNGRCQTGRSLVTLLDLVAGA